MKDEKNFTQEELNEQCSINTETQVGGVFDWNAPADPDINSNDYMHGSISGDIDEALEKEIIAAGLAAGSKVFKAAFSIDDNIKCNTGMILRDHANSLKQIVGGPITRRDALMIYTGYKARQTSESLDRVNEVIGKVFNNR